MILTNLQSLHGSIYDVFALDGLPSESEIQQLKDTLDTGGSIYVV